jgi:hypothetical protein
MCGRVVGVTCGDIISTLFVWTMSDVCAVLVFVVCDIPSSAGAGGDGTVILVVTACEGGILVSIALIR